MRMEKDALGKVMVPKDKLYGAQTQRAVENFKIGIERFPATFIHAHAMVKKAAARVNMKSGLLDKDTAKAIEQAATEVIQGIFDEHFPLAIWQSGSGTQTNMNVNEVIANRASQIAGYEMGKNAPVHPNDHVNMSQSTNDTVPTSMHISTVMILTRKLLPEIDKLQRELSEKSVAFSGIIKIGRTHLQDATPLTLGQEFSGYASQVQLAMENMASTLPHLHELAIGGTAVGTGLNTKKGYDREMVQQLRKITGIPFTCARNKFAGLAAHDAMVEISGALKSFATAIIKIANDIRWMGSGPRCGLGEIKFPANEPGSSMMPGKINPTQCEMITQVACQVIGNDAAITMACSQGNFELNVFKPVIIYNLLQSMEILSDACRSFRTKMIKGIKPNMDTIDRHLKNSLMLVTALNIHIGYEKSSQIALKAWRENKTLKEAAAELGILTEEAFERLVKHKDMIAPLE